MRLLDTNILSEIVRPRPDPRVMARLFAETHGTLFASEITRYELRRGACLRPDADVFWSRLEDLALPVAEWLSVTRPISLRAAELAANLQREGREIGTLDTFLAATAVTQGLILVSRNIRHFERVPGLIVENWFAEG